MVWKTAVNLTQLQATSRETITIDGKKILFILHEEQVYAIQAQCPHLNLPLAKGKINDACELTCPFHKSVFDLKTGAVKCWSPWPPAIGTLLGKLSKPKELKIYPTRMDGEEVWVDVG